MSETKTRMKRWMGSVFVRGNFTVEFLIGREITFLLFDEGIVIGVTRPVGGNAREHRWGGEIFS